MRVFWKIIILLMCTPLFSIAQQELKALADLRSLLPSQKEWVKVHVAEFLLWENYNADEVRAAFLEEELNFGHIPKYRIGIWRVLVQAAINEQQRLQWIDKIFAAYNDLEGQDRLHAIETLAKLKYPVKPDEACLSQIKTGEPDAFSIYSLWNAAYHPQIGEKVVKETCISLIQQKIQKKQYDLIPVISYVLRYTGTLQPHDWDKIKVITNGVKKDTSLYAGLLTTLLITADAGGSKKALASKKSLKGLKDSREATQQILLGLAACGNAKDLDDLLIWYTDIRDSKNPSYNADIHATAAYAILKISARLKKKASIN